MAAWARRLWARLRGLLGGGRSDAERAREIASHLALLEEEFRAKGLSEEEARRQAHIRLGNATVIREEVRQMSGVPFMENLWRDVAYALRQIRKSPGFAATAIVTLALGVGVNTAVFSVVNGLLLSSLHIRQESRVVTVGFKQKGTSWISNFSFAEFRDLRDQTKDVFSDVFAEQYGLDGLSVQGSQPERVFTGYVSGNYFEALGVRPLLGRFFLPSEGKTPGADPVMVLSYAYWKRYFGGDPNVIGRHVSLDGHPMTIIGVAPRSYKGVVTLLAVQAYLPLAMVVPVENIPQDIWNKRANRNMYVYARLAPGASAQQADAALAVLAHRFASEHPKSEKDAELRGFPLYLARTGNLDARNSIAVVSAFFLGLTGLVLLLACVNVANLLMVRATVRQREMVIRSALGAQRSRLVRQMLTESILLALFGGVGGIGLGMLGSTMLRSVNLQTDLPLYFDFGFDWHVFLFSVGTALLAGALVGLLPAMRVARANLNVILREGSRTVVSGGGRFRDALVVVQVGSALVLLIVAGLFCRSLVKLEHVNLGFNPSHVLAMTTDPSEIGYNDAQSRDFYQSLLTRLRALPGVESATTSGSIPMGVIDNTSDSVTVSGYQLPPGQVAPQIPYTVISTGYFRTMQIPLIEGRSFRNSDDDKSPYVAIVSEAMAKKFWPHEDAIGRTFTAGRDAAHPLQVVGVARDARYQDIDGPIAPYFYLPYLQHYQQNSLESLELRTAGDPDAVIPEIEGAIHRMAPALPIFEVKTMHQALYTPNGLLLYQVVAVMTGIMGILGLALAVIGVYGVLSYVVSRRVGEIGVRMALGAQRADILRMVYRQGLWIVGIGLVLGLGASLAVGHLLRSMIAVSATDPLTYIAVSAILMAIALLACYVPARRAMRVDPMQALRVE